MLSSCRRIKVVVAFVCSLLPTSRSFPTRYTIDDSVCAPLEEAELRKVVNRNCESLHKFLQKKPIATHTRAAFNQVSPLIDLSKPIVLDSGCGTARSTILLGDRFPDHTIVGVDRSFVRLNRNNLEGDDSFINPSEESQRPFQALSSNVLLVRAELTDFWRCCLDAEWNIEKHFILYPNPYPKVRPGSISFSDCGSTIRFFVTIPQHLRLFAEESPQKAVLCTPILSLDIATWRRYHSQVKLDGLLDRICSLCGVRARFLSKHFRRPRKQPSPAVHD
uniref:tRNA (guanine(46)-N(7))-methyltransferase n=1 Tax=Odontella aurita TaxID=265563 RepID=A0A6U6HII1_9STRA|mmetsp:Transcript_47727/g.144314  ORF Transcript_47727/g.144314 Transcript_47727/m.144314 type:complete len:277 (+) Transcript_47727:145-975(+)